jgi:hypothetical protein
MNMIKLPGRYEATVVEAVIDQPPGKDASVRLRFRTSENEEITTWLGLRNTVSPGKQKSPFEVSLRTLREAFGFDDNFAYIMQLEGKPCTIVCEHEDYEGKPRMRVKWINAPGGGGMAAATPAGADVLRGLTAAAKRVARPAGTVPAPQSQPKPQNPGRPF